MKITLLVQSGEIVEAFASDPDVKIEVIYADDENQAAMDYVERIQNEAFSIRVEEPVL